ncbi:SdiA-regulated domain-containing protein [Pedobacter sp. SYP-B3415]|uniref:SdiA-regulated domain-containing protein n=1 Tax=Pedobacter sp. SYP-B3415 TaxID=2496641 RepID=UPI00101BDCCC|nr:SdiA-regulated domain-containing protein [Pedobacter sp. SYP-B3415]
MKLRYLIYVYLLSFGVTACREKETFTSPAGYDLNKPEKFVMPESLLEISGICFRPGQSDTIYSIQDEEGRLFRQQWGVKAQKNSRFAGDGDYEDVTFLNEHFFILKSNGQIYSLPASATAVPDGEEARIHKKLVPKGEYEGLYADQHEKRLYMLCKNCKGSQAGSAGGYVLTPNAAADSITVTGQFSVTGVQTGASKKKKKPEPFRPSALARHPVTGDWFILSSFNKLIVVAGADWKAKSQFALDGSVFNQPEGIAFDPSGNLYISNEGAEIEAGNILKFKYHP